MKFRYSGKPWDRARYDRVVAYECRRNGTESYTPHWAVTP